MLFFWHLENFHLKKSPELNSSSILIGISTASLCVLTNIKVNNLLRYSQEKRLDLSTGWEHHWLLLIIFSLQINTEDINAIFLTVPSSRNYQIA